MEKLNAILAEFSSISLKERENVKLMDRKDTKYVFKFQQLPEYLEQLKNDYSILVVETNRVSRYESLYFDTKKFDLYHSHHRGKPNRFKIRFRKYVASNLNFFEIKFKNNKGRTIKSRVKQKEIDGFITDKAEVLLKEKTPLFPNELEAKLWVNYSRITFVNKNFPERVTIDIDLSFKKDEEYKTIPNLVIAEVKQDKAAVSVFIKLMKKNHVRAGSISKYCFGVINLFNKIKHNNFKPNLNLIKKKLTAKY